MDVDKWLKKLSYISNAHLAGRIAQSPGGIGMYFEKKTIYPCSDAGTSEGRYKLP